MQLLLPLTLLPARLGAICALVAGLIYFFKPSPMSYHQRFLQTPFAELPPTSQRLMLALMQAAGSGLIAIGLTLGYLVWGPVPAHAPGALTAAMILLASAMIPMVVTTVRLALYTPWWLIAALGIAGVAGLWAFAGA